MAGIESRSLSKTAKRWAMKLLTNQTPRECRISVLPIQSSAIFAGIGINMIALRWLSTPEAVAYSKLGKDRLKRLVLEGKIKGGQDPEDHNRWFYCKYSIDDYREGQVNELRLKAAAIWEKNHAA
jgi:hypothetical protein